MIRVNTVRLAVLASSLALVGSAFAATGEEIIKTKGCVACHQVDKAGLGPSYKDVAKKYAGDKSAEAKLVEKVLKGGGGVWNMPTMKAMPANTTVKADEAKAAVKYILSFK